LPEKTKKVNAKNVGLITAGVKRGVFYSPGKRGKIEEKDRRRGYGAYIRS
jgi:hypothetical protein